MPEREPLLKKYKRHTGPLILAAIGFGTVVWGAVEANSSRHNLDNKLGQATEEQRDNFRRDQDIDSTNSLSKIVGGIIVEFGALGWAIGRETKARKIQSQQSSTV